MNGSCIKTNSTVPRPGRDIMKEPMWTFDVDYVTQNYSTYNCYVMRVFYEVPSYMIYVRRPRTFFRMVQMLHETGSCT